MHEPQHPIRIGYLSNFSPFCSTRSDRPEGLIVDRLGSCIALLGLDVVWIPTSLDEQVDWLLTGRLDLIAALGITAERSEVVAFTHSLIETGGALFSRRDATESPTTIVTPRSGPLVGSVQRSFPDSELRLVGDYKEALDAVSDGEAGAAALNLHVGAEMADRMHPGQFRIPDRPFHVVRLAAAFEPGRLGGLRHRIDQIITGQSNEGSPINPAC
jgi:ABC-type amino acid transport substrate-binding protein